MSTNPIVILGAGATKACGGPLTNEILKFAFNRLRGASHRERLEHLRGFLKEHFFLNLDKKWYVSEDFPELPFLLSLVDTAIDRKQNFSATWTSQRLVEVRESIDWAVFSVIKEMLGRVKPYHSRLLKKVFDRKEDPTIVTLNYDTIIDNVLIQIGSKIAGPRGRSNGAAFPDYGCDFQTEGYHKARRWGKLFKIHGSMNWIYCPNCSTIDLAISRSGLGTVKALGRLFPDRENDIENRMETRGSGCRRCQAKVQPILVTPSHLKDYRNPHVRQVWFKAEQALRESSHAYFIGYSLPADDVDVAYLLKRGLGHLSGSDITVVEMDKGRRSAEEHPTGQRFRQLFGPEINWYNAGMRNWLE